jgi:hypothetical protein
MKIMKNKWVKNKKRSRILHLNRCDTVSKALLNLLYQDSHHVKRHPALKH